MLIVLAVVLVGGGAGAYFALKDKKPAKNSTPVFVSTAPTSLTIDFADGRFNLLYPKNPYVAEDSDYNLQMYEGLVRFEGSKIIPMLATGWTNPNDNTWRFVLRDDVKFSDGNMMVADDVVYSFNQFKTNTDWSLTTDTVKEVKAVDAKTVDIVTKSPDPVLLNRLAYFFIIDHMSDPKAFAASGTGAYMLDPAHTPTETDSFLIANDKYYGGVPHVTSLHFQVMEDAKVVQAAKDGKVDVTDFYADKTFDKDFIEAGLVASAPFSDVGASLLRVNTKKAGPLAKKEVRQAINYALDRQKIIGDLNAEARSQPVSIDIPGFNPDLKAFFQDIPKAKALLTTAGYPNGFSTSLSYYNGTSSLASIQSIADQLAVVGIKVKLVPLGANDLLSAVDTGKLDMVDLSFSTDLLDSVDVNDYLYTNTVLYNNPEVNTLITTSNITVDATKRVDILKSIAAKTYDDAAVIPLFARVYKFYHSKNINPQKVLPNSDVRLYFKDIK